jgi:hypothetical protein
VSFPVWLSGASATPVSVHFTVAHGSAYPGPDLAPKSGTVSFAPHETAKSVVVAVKGDSVSEGNEWFTVDLDAPDNVVIGDGQGVGTIVDDEGAIGMSVDDPSVVEGASDADVSLEFTVRLSAPPVVGQTVKVTAATVNGSAKSASDYAKWGPTVLTFAPGQTSQTVPVSVHGDATVEANESLTLRLSGPWNAHLADPTGTGTIVNDDGTPGAMPRASVSVSDVTRLEGAPGQHPSAVFELRLSSARTIPTRVMAHTVDGTATAGSDYVAAPTKDVWFAAGVTSKLVAVTLNGDAYSEGNETFTLALATPQGGVRVADDAGLATIADEEGLPIVRVSDAELSEPTSGTEAMQFDVALTGSLPPGTTLGVDVATVAGSASSGVDYGPTGPVTLWFTESVNTNTFTVPLFADALAEPNETYQVVLSLLSTRLASADEAATGIIRDP